MSTETEKESTPPPGVVYTRLALAQNGTKATWPLICYQTTIYADSATT